MVDVAAAARRLQQVETILLLLDLGQIFNVLPMVSEGNVFTRFALGVAFREVGLVGGFIPEVEHNFLGDGRLEFGTVRARVVAAAMITTLALACA